MSRRTPRNCANLDNWVFENFILIDEPSTKVSQIFEACVSVDNNIWEKLVLSLEIPI